MSTRVRSQKFAIHQFFDRCMKSNTKEFEPLFVCKSVKAAFSAYLLLVKGQGSAFYNGPKTRPE